MTVGERPEKSMLKIQAVVAMGDMIAGGIAINVHGRDGDVVVRFNLLSREA